MAEEKNIYQRLMQARLDFAKKNIEPSGYNAHLNFDYLELKDIVPVANKVFADNKIMLITSFTETECVGIVHDLLGKEEPIYISIPLPDPTKDAERMKLNVAAMTGSYVTYMRRYMLMLVLDICINDEVDADDKDTPVVAPAEKATPKKEKVGASEEKPTVKPTVKAKVNVASAEKKAPVTAAKRTEIKKELTDADGKADELQVQTLKALAMRWVNACPDDKQVASEILVKTNGFNDVTRKEADALIDMINKKIEDAEGDKK